MVLRPPGQAVPEVDDLLVPHVLAGAFQGVRELARLLDRHALIAVAVEDVDRDRRLLHVVEGGQPADRGVLVLPVEGRAERDLVERPQLRQPGAGDGALVGRIRPYAGRHGRVAAVGVAEDRDPVLGRDALPHEPARAVVLVVLHLLAPLAVPGAPQRLAEALGPPVLRLQHDVPPVGEELRPAVPAEEVPGPRAAVGQHDRGEGPLAFPRNRQESGDLHAVAGFVSHERHVRELLRQEVREAPAERDELPAVDQQVVQAGLARPRRAHHDDGQVVRHRHPLVHHAFRQRRGQPFLQRPALGLRVLAHDARGETRETDDLPEVLRVGRGHDPDGVDVPAAEQGFAEFAGNEVVGADDGPVAARVVAHVDAAPVRVEADGLHAFAVRGVQAVVFFPRVGLGVAVRETDVDVVAAALDLLPPAHGALDVAEDGLVGGAPVDALGVVAAEIDLVEVGGELEVGDCDEHLVLVLRQQVEDPHAEDVPVAEQFRPPAVTGNFVEVGLLPEPARGASPGADVELLAPDDQQPLVVQPEHRPRLHVRGPEPERLCGEVGGLPDGHVGWFVDVAEGQRHQPPAVGTHVDAVDDGIVDPGAHGDAFGRRRQRKGDAEERRPEPCREGACHVRTVARPAGRTPDRRSGSRPRAAC